MKAETKTSKPLWRKQRSTVGPGSIVVPNVAGSSPIFHPQFSWSNHASFSVVWSFFIENRSLDFLAKSDIYITACSWPSLGCATTQDKLLMTDNLSAIGVGVQPNVSYRLLQLVHYMPSGGPLSSTDSATGVPALFVCFSGTMEPSAPFRKNTASDVHVGVMASRLFRPIRFLERNGCRWGLSASARKVSNRACGLRLRGNRIGKCDQEHRDNLRQY